MAGHVISELKRTARIAWWCVVLFASAETALVGAFAPERIAGLPALLLYLLTAAGVFSVAALLGVPVVLATALLPTGRGPLRRLLQVALGTAVLWWFLRVLWAFPPSPLRGTDLGPVSLAAAVLSGIIAWLLLRHAPRFRERLLARPVWLVALPIAAGLAVLNAIYLPYGVEFLHLRLLAVVAALLAFGLAVLRSTERPASMAWLAVLVLVSGSTLWTISPTRPSYATLASRGFFARTLVQTVAPLLSRTESVSHGTGKDAWIRVLPAVDTGPTTLSAAPVASPQASCAIWLSIDTVRGADAYDPTLMPALARFSTDAVQFRNARSIFPSTWYSLPAVLSSRTLPPTLANPTAPSPLQSVLKSASVETHGLSFLRDFKRKYRGKRIFETGFNSVDWDVTPHAVETAAEALASKGGRFFLWAHSGGAHLDTLSPFDPRLLTFGWRRTEYERRLREDADAWLADVLGRLESKPWYSRCVVAIFSDHGEGFGEHGHYFHAFAPYEEVVRIPFVVRVPGRGGEVRDEPVSTLDLAPTTAALLGVTPPASFEGRVLFPADGEPPPPQGLLLVNPSSLLGAGNRILNQATLDAEGRWKLHRDVELGALELYDLHADPGETRNLIAEEPEVRARMLELERQLDARARQQ